MKSVGCPTPHIRGKEIVTGGIQYVTDLKLPDMLHGRVIRSPIPHGKIVNVDVKKALKVPGVKVILTGENVPHRKFGTLLDDWEILATEKVRFVGDEVAAVAATDPDSAEEAIRNIVVEYEELPAIFDPKEALKPGAPLIHEKERNIAMTYQVERGDIETGFMEADFIYENTFSSPQIYHAYLEPNGCTAQSDHQGRLTLYIPTQTPSVTRVLYAKALGIPMEKLRLVIPPYGGAFGGKQASKLHVIAGMLAIKSGRPVHMAISRAEDFISGNPKVHLYIDVKIGAKRDGTLIAKEVEVVGGAGGRVVYAPIVTSTACSRVDSLYHFKNLKTVGYTVYTNTTPTAAYRGFGHPEALVAVESSIDMIAEGLGLDPVEVRLKNSIRQGEISIHGYKITSCGLQECIRTATDKAQFQDKHRRSNSNRGVGMACCNHVSGNRLLFRDFDGSAALIKVGRDGDVTLIHGESDMGQGQDTVLAQIAAEELGIPISHIRVSGVDTDVSPFGLGSVSSRGTFFGGNAVKEAARDARRQILEEARDILEADIEDLRLEDGKIFVNGAPQVSISFHQAVQAFCNRKAGMPIIGMGSYTPNTEIPDFKTMYGNISPAYPFACHVAEVEVDRDTGVVHVVRYVAAHDIGKAINPMLAEGQVQGGIAQGIGFTLMEEIRFDRGIMENPNFQDYIVPGPSDLPRMEVIFVETNDPEGPYGAKGVGEPALDPVPAAIANAIYDAVGVRMTRLPITPERLRTAIRAKEQDSPTTGD